MLKSLILPDTARFFPQAFGACYHYAPTTAALLYEVVPLYHRGKARPGNSIAKSEAMTALDLSGRLSVAAICHKTPSGVNAAIYTVDETGDYSWQQRAELPWEGMPTQAQLVFIRRLFCPLRAFRHQAALTTDTRIVNIDLQEFLSFAQVWVEEQPYYFPALRQVELAAQWLASPDRKNTPYLTVDSLVSFGCLVTMREVGSTRRFSPDLFDEHGNAIPSKTRINPISTVYRGSRTDKKMHVPRAAIVWELFTNGPASGWDGYRADHNPSNDRIENLVSPGFKCRHNTEYSKSVATYDYVFPYKAHLPSEFYYSRFWRYGIERLAWDIDETIR